MTRQEWIKEAEDYERKAQEYLERGDEIASDLASVKAAACRNAATFSPDEQDTGEATR